MQMPFYLLLVGFTKKEHQVWIAFQKIFFVYTKSTSLFPPTHLSVHPVFVRSVSHNFVLLKSPWDHPRPALGVDPRHNPGEVWARFTMGKLSLECAREVGTF